jgi:hypothetical protein
MCTTNCLTFKWLTCIGILPKIYRLKSTISLSDAVQGPKESQPTPYILTHMSTEAKSNTLKHLSRHILGYDASIVYLVPLQ